MLEANRAKDYAAAQRAAEAAYRLHPDPNLLFNLGRFHQKQGHKAEAIDYYQHFLASGDSSLTPDLLQDIERYLAELRRPPGGLPPPVLAPNAPGGPLRNVGLSLIRQSWREVFSLQAGYLFGWRRFTDANDTGFNVAGSTTGLPGAHGLALQGEIYPLAASLRMPLAAAGLGMRVAVLLPFWPGVVQKDTAGNRLGAYSISELRIDWGFLHWHWNISETLLRPELVLEALYGYHRFDFARQENSAIVLPLPSAGYQYLGGSVGMRMHFPYRIAAQVGLMVAGILDMGPMGLPGSDGTKPPGQDLGFLVYGPGSGVLVRFDVGFFVPIYKGLGVSAAGFYERTALSFDGLGDVLDKSKQPVRSATDEYTGLIAGLRYWY